MLKRDVLEYRREYEQEWDLVYAALTSNTEYEKYFPGIGDAERKEEMKERFLRSFISVVTRCFGWGLPKTMVVPFADCINHHNVDSTYEMFKPEWHSLNNNAKTMFVPMN